MASLFVRDVRTSRRFGSEGGKDCGDRLVPTAGTEAPIAAAGGAIVRSRPLERGSRFMSGHLVIFSNDRSF